MQLFEKRTLSELLLLIALERHSISMSDIYANSFLEERFSALPSTIKDEYSHSWRYMLKRLFVTLQVYTPPLVQEVIAGVGLGICGLLFINYQSNESDQCAWYEAP